MTAGMWTALAIVGATAVTACVLMGVAVFLGMQADDAMKENINGNF